MSPPRHCGTQHETKRFVYPPFIVRQAFVCPECQLIKDAFERYVGVVNSRWCHNYSFHQHAGRRKMEPTAIFRHIPSGEEVA